DLPVVNTTNHLILILDPLEVNGAAEIVQVTAHSAAATSITVVRGFENSVARTHILGTTWFHGPVASDYTLSDVTSGTRPAVPYAGGLIYESDTNSYVARDNANTWLTAVPLGGWLNYVPTFTQSTTITKTTNYARYIQVGKIITVSVYLTATGLGTAANPILIALPVSANGSVQFLAPLGTAMFFDSSAGGRHQCVAV